MSTLLNTWKAEGSYNKDVKLEEYEYSDGSRHYLFRDRFGRPANPNKREAEQIIKRWKMKKI